MRTVFPSAQNLNGHFSENHPPTQIRTLFGFGKWYGKMDAPLSLFWQILAQRALTRSWEIPIFLIFLITFPKIQAVPIFPINWIVENIGIL